MLQFFGRGDELEFLKERYGSGKPELIVITGRRRVGKTALVEKFLKDKKGAYILAERAPEQIERRRFARTLSKAFDTYIEPGDTWSDPLSGVTDLDRPVIVVDEFPYWIQYDEGVTSAFQTAWDRKLSNSSAFIIIMGSLISVMESNVLSRRSPIYGRRTGQLKLEPFEPWEIDGFLKKWENDELVCAYSALGGIPYYLKEMDSSQSFIENVRNTIFEPTHPLGMEIDFILSEELREVAIYELLLGELSKGTCKIMTVADRVGIDRGNIYKYLGSMERLGIVTRVRPTLPKGKLGTQSRFIVSDPFFRFWTRFAYPYRSELAIRQKDGATTFLKKEMNAYLGVAFEDVVRRSLPHIVSGIVRWGTWWHKGEEIDIIGISSTGPDIVGECKWSDLTAGEARSIVDDLARRSGIWDPKKNIRFLIAAKTVKNRKELESEGVIIVELEDIFNIN